MNTLHGFFWEGDINEYFPGHQFSEIFKERIYDPYFQGRTNLNVIDVGGNLGIFSLYAQPFSKIIYTLEPSQKAYEAIVMMKEFNHFDNIIPLKIALANTDGTQTFYHRPGNKTMDSLVPDIKTGTTEQVKTIRLDTLFKEQKIEHIDVLKLDCEGGEYSIIGGDGFANVADKIDVIIGEYHLWGDEIRNLSQFRDGFLENGFSFKEIPGEAHLFCAERRK